MLIPPESTRVVLPVVAAGSLEPMDSLATYASISPYSFSCDCAWAAPPASAASPTAIAVIRAWKGEIADLNLPSAPRQPLVLAEQPDRPQPRRDVNLGNGMTVTVGRVREDAIFHLKLVAMGHNTIRGAAGSAVLNAETLVAMGRLGWSPPARA